MTDLNIYLTQQLSSKNNIQNRTIFDVITFFVNNNWFHAPPSVENGKAFVTQKEIDIYTPYLIDFLSTDCDNDELISRLKSKFSHTTNKLLLFIKQKKSDENPCHYLFQFLLERLEKEIALYTDPEIASLVNLAAIDLTKAHGDCLTFFLSWLKRKCKTAYFKEYTCLLYTSDAADE